MTLIAFLLTELVLQTQANMLSTCVISFILLLPEPSATSLPAYTTISTLNNNILDNLIYSIIKQ